MKTQENSDRCLGYRMVIAALLALVVGQGFLLWGTTREVRLLPQLARTGALSTPGPVLELGLPELMDGLSRLEGAPELLLDQAQAARLLPVLPLCRQALTWGVEVQGEPAPERFGPMLRDYLVRTLRPEQRSHLARLSARGELASAPDAALARLVSLDKDLRRRAGVALERFPSVQSPVRTSLERLRIRDLVLGMLLLEQDPQVRLTAEQASMMLPMEPLFRDIFELKTGAIGQNLLPVVDAQVRSILTEAQQHRLLQVLSANRLSRIEVDEEDVLRQFIALLGARRQGAAYTFRLRSLTTPPKAAREGPTVIPAEAELELQVAILGIVLHLEPRKDLRLSQEQVTQLTLLAPGIQEVLKNLSLGVKDDRQPEIQVRVARILTPEQVRHILRLRSEPVRWLEPSGGQHPLAADFERFIKSRGAGIPFVSSFRVESSSTPRASTVHSTSSHPGGLGPGAARDSRVPLKVVVRRLLFELEQDEGNRLEDFQVEKVRTLLPEIQEALKAIDRGQPPENEPDLTRQLEEILTEKQRASVFLKDAGEEDPPGQRPASGGSSLSSELGNFVRSRLAPDHPLSSEESRR